MSSGILDAMCSENLKFGIRVRPMRYYDTQQVCLNGHQVTDSYHSSPEFRKNFCATCGAKTIHQCPECNRDIPGDYKVDGVVAIGFRTKVPTHCANCGKPFPWAALKSQLGSVAADSRKVNSLALVEQLCGRFHLIARQIKSRHANRETLVVKMSMTYKTSCTLFFTCTSTISDGRNGHQATLAEAHESTSC